METWQPAAIEKTVFVSYYCNLQIHAYIQFLSLTQWISRPNFVSIPALHIKEEMGKLLQFLISI